MYQINNKRICCLAGDLLADVVKAETNVGGVGVGNGAIGVSSVGSGVSSVSGGGVEEGRVGLSLPLLAAEKTVGVSGDSVSGVSSGAWDGDVGSVNAGGRLEGGKSVGTVGTVGVGESSVEEGWVGLGLSVDGGDKGAKNNLKIDRAKVLKWLALHHYFITNVTRFSTNAQLILLFVLRRDLMSCLVRDILLIVWMPVGQDWFSKSLFTFEIS